VWDVALPSAAEAALLIAAGVVAGAVNSVAGGGALITFPALLATGLPSVTANTSNHLSMCTGFVASVAGTWRDLDGQRSLVRRLAPTAVVGTLIGAALLLLTPPGVFDVLVPILVLLASGVLACQDRLLAMVGDPRRLARGSRMLGLQALTFVCAIYGGYFGGALGVVLMAALALVLDERLPRIGALKNALLAVVGLVAATAYGLFGPISWGSVLVLAPATMAGGYFGAVLSRRLPPVVMRQMVAGLGVTISVFLGTRAVV
jgi:uncharacterized membrane protein YfcA